MSGNREETVRQFCDVTGADEVRSKFFLESSNWQLEVSNHTSAKKRKILIFPYTFIHVAFGIFLKIIYNNNRKHQPDILFHYRKKFNY